MKPRFTALYFCTAASLLFTIHVNAQSKTATATLQGPPADIKIDGDLKEWGDSLRYYNQDKKLNYALANDKRTCIWPLGLMTVPSRSVLLRPALH